MYSNANANLNSSERMSSATKSQLYQSIARTQMHYRFDPNKWISVTQVTLIVVLGAERISARADTANSERTKSLVVKLAPLRSISGRSFPVRLASCDRIDCYLHNASGLVAYATLNSTRCCRSSARAEVGSRVDKAILKSHFFVRN